MRTELELKAIDVSFSQEEVISLIDGLNNSQPIKNSSASVKLPTSKIGELASFDPSTLKLIIDIANVGALGVALKGFFDFIIEWQKNRSQKMTIKVGDISLEIPINASQQQILQLTEKVLELAKELKSNPKRKKG